MKPRGTFRGPEVELGKLRSWGPLLGEVRAQDVRMEGGELGDLCSGSG